MSPQDVFRLYWNELGEYHPSNNPEVARLLQMSGYDMSQNQAPPDSVSAVPVDSMSSAPNVQPYLPAPVEAPPIGGRGIQSRTMRAIPDSTGYRIQPIIQ